MRFLCLLVFGLLWLNTEAQVIKGTVKDPTTGETLIGASVVIKGTTIGSITDLDGNFQIKTDRTPPIILEVSFLGYQKQEVTVNDFNTEIKVKLSADNVLLDAVEIVDSRISDKQKQNPLTVESMDVLAIKEAPSGNFYEGLANMTGVDMTSASLGFKVINTRGFNSTSPVRSLQLIDGVDNQSPGLNFSLGNFLGASDLDVMKVDIIAGASSAFYGPGAFNGVINMTTKDPFLFKGLSASAKIGERQLQEYAVRWADVIKNKEGKEKFAYKINMFYMQALDWEAENYNPVDGLDVGADNPGGFDAVNIYGDEEFADYTTPEFMVQYPGLGKFFRTGYREVDLADYNTDNLKFNTGLYYKIAEKITANYSFSYSTGTTIYQGDNRYSLKDIQFRQHKFEVNQKDKWFVRAYMTNEDAGQSYDLVTTALRLNEATIDQIDWETDYRRNWAPFRRDIPGLPGYPQLGDFNGIEADWAVAFNEWIVPYQDSLTAWHAITRARTDTMPRRGDPRLEVGTPAFDSTFNDIRSRKFTQNGSLFFDRSALYHTHAEYKFSFYDIEFTTGGNYRAYRPNSQGTIFQDTVSYTRLQTDTGVIFTDSAYRVITNQEFGLYLGGTRSFAEGKYRVTATLRVDKNENFDYLWSPAASFVYTPNPNHTLRFSFSSAVRNPTLADQYLYYNVGRAILLGNLNGYDSLVTTESLVDALQTFNQDTLEYFNVNPIVPEQVRTIEAGYRGMFWNKLYVDVSAYNSWYENFIGFVIGADPDFNILGFLNEVQIYRLATNAQSTVTTRGINLGTNYYYAKKHAVNANYSFNELVSGEDDPIIPAFNTPRNKFNVGVSGREIIFPFLSLGQFGYGVNYKWVQGFVFEGSPQFTGEIESYGLVDAQVNYTVPAWHTTFKFGASNVLNNRVFQVYGGPQIGRLAYFSIVFDWDYRN